MVQLNVFVFIAGFVRTLLIILVIYYLIRFVSKVVLPMFNPPQQRASNFQQENRRPEGDVTIVKKRKRGSNIQEDDGEYVDFEEVD